MWANYDRIAGTVQNSGARFLHGETVALLLHAIELINDRDYWHDTDYEPVSDSAWNEIDLALSTAIDNVMTEIVSGSGNMVGEIKAVATLATPSDCLLCDGTQYLRVDYPDLYAILDTSLIVDADNFVVPDLRGRFVLGVSTTYAEGATGGEVSHTLTEAELPSHTHQTANNVLETAGTLNRSVGSGSESRYRNATTTATGGNQAHNNMPPYYALKYVIVATAG